MGRCYESMERWIEATYAYGEACSFISAFPIESKHYTGQLNEAARRCWATAKRAYEEAGMDENLIPLLRYGERVARQYNKPPKNPLRAR